MFGRGEPFVDTWVGPVLSAHRFQLDSQNVDRRTLQYFVMTALFWCDDGPARYIVMTGQESSRTVVSSTSSVVSRHWVDGGEALRCSIRSCRDVEYIFMLSSGDSIIRSH
jgi:hypothetical protein